MSTALTQPSTPAAPEFPPPTRAPRASGGGWHTFQGRSAPYLFVAPFVLTFALFGLYPLVKSILLAFYATNGPKSQVFVGLHNFVYMAHDSDFWQAVHHTVVFALWSVFLQLPIALGLAILMNQPWLRAKSFFRLALFSPNLYGQVFMAILFQQLFLVHFGLINTTLHWLTFGHFSLETKWLTNPANVMPSLVITSLWLYCGFNMIYFLAALQAVDKELYEAARVDGANSWQQFVHVTAPGIKPIAVFVLITSTIGSLQLFELPYILLQNTAGPDNAGSTIVMYLYQNGFVIGDLGYASAVGWTLAIVILLVSLIQVRATGVLKKANAQ